MERRICSGNVDGSRTGVDLEVRGIWNQDRCGWGTEAFYRKEVKQAVKVNERVPWPMFWTPRRHMLQHP